MLLALTDHQHLQEITIDQTYMSVSTKCIALLGTAKWWKRLRKLQMLNIQRGEAGPWNDSKHFDSALAALQKSKFLQDLCLGYQGELEIPKENLMAIALSCPNLKRVVFLHHISCEDLIQIMKAVDHSSEELRLYKSVESDEFFSHLGQCQNLKILQLIIDKPGMTFNT